MSKQRDDYIGVRVPGATKALAVKEAVARGSSLADEVNKLLERMARKYERREK